MNPKSGPLRLHRRWLAPLLTFVVSLTLGRADAVAQTTPEETEKGPSAEPAEQQQPEHQQPEPKVVVNASHADSSPPLVQPPQPAPPNSEPIPATVVSSGQAPAPQNLAPYVQHLGPESFPGRLRGLYGGSLWLEPSFAGLQWPYMANTGIGVSGSFWIDNGYETITRDRAQSLLPNSQMFFQQGRGVLRLTPTYVSGSFFIQGQSELVGNLCQTASAQNTVCNTGTFTTDDLWIRVGRWNSWDVKVGRFEGWEVYHLGMGLEPYTLARAGAGMFAVESGDSGNNTQKLEAPALYGVSYLHDRPTDGLAVGYAALHLYPTESLRFELLAKMGTDNTSADKGATNDDPATYLGGRPTAIFDIGWLKFKVGGEYHRRFPITQTIEPGTPGKKKAPVAKVVQMGVGASLQFVVDPIVEFGFNGAAGKQTNTDGFGKEVPDKSSFTTTSLGVFANVRLAALWLAGVGVNWTAQTDKFLATGSTVNDYTSHLQGFGSLQYLLAGQLFIKAEAAVARAYFQPSDTTVTTWNNTMYSGAVRLMYLY